ncbi:MAG: hypothetical protein VX654_01950 [Chloroflexota bacterium]|nr:hypothetical protein [Chloroflexota bacterium]
MPGLACQDLYRWIVDLDLALAGRILFITGVTVNPETKKFMDTVPNLLVAKPFEFSEVERLVRSLVERCSQHTRVNRGESAR